MSVRRQTPAVATDHVQSVQATLPNMSMLGLQSIEVKRPAEANKAKDEQRQRQIQNQRRAEMERRKAEMEREEAERNRQLFTHYLYNGSLTDAGLAYPNRHYTDKEIKNILEEYSDYVTKKALQMVTPEDQMPSYNRDIFIELKKRGWFNEKVAEADELELRSITMLLNRLYETKEWKLAVDGEARTFVKQEFGTGVVAADPAGLTTVPTVAMKQRGIEVQLFWSWEDQIKNARRLHDIVAALCTTETDRQDQTASGTFTHTIPLRPNDNMHYLYVEGVSASEGIARQVILQPDQSIDELSCYCTAAKNGYGLQVLASAVGGKVQNGSMCTIVLENPESMVGAQEYLLQDIPSVWQQKVVDCIYKMSDDIMHTYLGLGGVCMVSNKGSDDVSAVVVDFKQNVKPGRAILLSGANTTLSPPKSSVQLVNMLAFALNTWSYLNEKIVADQKHALLQLLDEQIEAFSSQGMPGYKKWRNDKHTLKSACDERLYALARMALPQYTSNGSGIEHALEAHRRLFYLFAASRPRPPVSVDEPRRPTNDAPTRPRNQPKSSKIQWGRMFEGTPNDDPQKQYNDNHDSWFWGRYADQHNLKSEEVYDVAYNDEDGQKLGKDLRERHAKGARMAVLRYRGAVGRRRFQGDRSYERIFPLYVDGRLYGKVADDNDWFIDNAAEKIKPMVDEAMESASKTDEKAYAFLYARLDYVIMESVRLFYEEPEESRQKRRSPFTKPSEEEVAQYKQLQAAQKKATSKPSKAAQKKATSSGCIPNTVSCFSSDEASDSDPDPEFTAQQKAKRQAAQQKMTTLEDLFGDMSDSDGKGDLSDSDGQGDLSDSDGQGDLSDSEGQGDLSDSDGQGGSAFA